MMGSAIIFETTFPYCIVPVYVFVCHMFPYHPFYFDFHSARVIFDVSSSFYFWNVNRTPTWHLSKMFKVAFKDASTKNSEPTYWTILFVMLKIYFICKVAEKNSRRASLSDTGSSCHVTVMGSLIVLVNKRADWNVPVSYIKYMSPWK
jgi:hypothetical protein